MITTWKRAARKVVPRRLYAHLGSSLRYVTSLRYVGSAYTCPFCEGRFSAFLPAGVGASILHERKVVGAGYRLNAICPRCHSVDRERLVYLFLKERRSAIFSEHIALLHVAPEPSLSQTLRKCGNIAYVSADLDSRAADVRMDITDIKREDSSYDVIICNHVLEHIPDDGRAMRELFRVLKPRGFAILQVPISFASEVTFEDPSIVTPERREECFGQRDHVRVYGRDYSKRLEVAGFEVTTYTPEDFLSPSQIREHALLQNEIVFLCSKP